MTDDIQTESYPLYEEEEAGLGLMVAEPPYRELSSLHFEENMKNKSHPKVTFKWSSIDKALLPALSGVVKSEPLTVQRYEIFQ